MKTLIEKVASLPKSKRKKFYESLSADDVTRLYYDWDFWARKEQLPPDGDWMYWLLLAGRGFGKTRTGSEFIRHCAEQGQYKRIGLIGRTAADVRDIMLYGESGLMKICPIGFYPDYQPSKRRLVWPNGVIATHYSAEKPDGLRGPEHDLLWVEELASWKYPEAWDMAKFGLRIGNNPRAIITTTPKPVKVIRELLKRDKCVVTRGSTYDNVENLAEEFFNEVISSYEGTRLGRQEIHAEILDDVPGALWKRKMIDDYRVWKKWEELNLWRIVVAVDPAVTSNEGSDKTGIIVVGKGNDGRGYVLEDLSCIKSPEGWAKTVVEAYYKYGADRVIAEVNNGGDLVERILRIEDENVSYKSVHASRGKYVRAEPVSALYEQGKISHVGKLETLEDWMCQFLPEGNEGSPDEVDALVWGLTDLFIDKEKRTYIGRAG
jgi:phage terminase large subunit-like protein